MGLRALMANIYPREKDTLEESSYKLCPNHQPEGICLSNLSNTPYRLAGTLAGKVLTSERIKFQSRQGDGKYGRERPMMDWTRVQ